MALLTAPLIAIIYVTPIYILNGMPDMSYFVMLPIFTMPILIAWFLNILFIFLIDKPWVLSYWRTLIICTLMFLVSGIVVMYVRPSVRVSDAGITLIRIVNILSVNSIIYVLIDLILTKENKSKIELENANLRIVTLEAEFKSLKDQINPHFLFNALSTAKALVKQQPQLAEDYLIKLSDFLRASINNDHKTVSLKDELQLCKDFVSLNQIRFGKALQAEYSMPANVSEAYIPYFAIVSLLENALKHNSLTPDAPLKISIAMQGNMLEVRNNKNVKFIMEAPSKTGLQNLNERYKLISGKEITIKETDNEFIVLIPILPK
ncbi:MAG: sensor histidine kinase [Bacteroidia bacterium]